MSIRWYVTCFWWCSGPKGALAMPALLCQSSFGRSRYGEAVCPQDPATQWARSRQADCFSKIRHMWYIRLYSAKIWQYFWRVDWFQWINQKLYSRFYLIHSVYSVYSHVFEQHSILFRSILCLFFSKSRWLRWVRTFYLLEPEFHTHNIINLASGKFFTSQHFGYTTTTNGVMSRVI